MLQQMIRVGSFFLVVSACLSSMQGPTLKDITAQRVAELIAQDPGYGVKAFNALPRNLSIAVIQQLGLTNKRKSALPIALLSYKLHQQQQLDSKHYKLRLLLANNEQVELNPELSKELVQASVTIKNFVQDINIQDTAAVEAEEMPLSLLTQEQIAALLPYISITNALNTSDSTLPIVQQEIPEVTTLSHYWIKYTGIKQLKEYLTTQTIPMLCDLIIAASYLDIYNDEQTVNFIELATHALGNQLLQLPQYQDQYTIINTLPDTIQHMLVRYLIDNSAVRYALCNNSTDVIINTAQTLTGPSQISSVSCSLDSKHIASGYSDGTVKVWDVQSGTCMHW